MRKISRSIMLSIALALAAGMPGWAGAVDRLDVERALAAARDAHQQADSVGGAWRDTAKMIRQAEKLMQEGQLDEALELARDAEAQGMLGYLQATAQSSLDKLHID